jgi:hypothetical protein
MGLPDSAAARLRHPRSNYRNRQPLRLQRRSFRLRIARKGLRADSGRLRMSSRCRNGHNLRSKRRRCKRLRLRWTDRRVSLDGSSRNNKLHPHRLRLQSLRRRLRLNLLLPQPRPNLGHPSKTRTKAGEKVKGSRTTIRTGPTD